MKYLLRSSAASHRGVCARLHGIAPVSVAIAGIIGGGLIARSANAQAPRPQTQSDDYTRYELLAPGSSKFRILYEVTATTPRATRFFNVIRKGSVASNEAVFDRMTGAALKFEVVRGTVARAGGVQNADTTGEYIQVQLARPVPDGGEARLLIDKTYEDAKSYLVAGDTITFTRSLGIKRNAVVLPPGYELIGANYPSQVRTEGDGRLAVSFMNAGTAEVPYTVRARCVRRAAGACAPFPPVSRTTAPALNNSPAAAAATPSRDARLAERAHADREIVYFLQQPESHSFDLYHDYTESRPGTDKYINVVRGGSKVSKPSARILDTGESLGYEVMKGAAITAAKLDIGEPVTPATEVVVIRFSAVKAGQSVRLRISETYTDSARYRLEGDELMWDRSFGRPANAVVLPAGWYLTNSSIPGSVTVEADGRVRVDFVNARNDDIAVFMTARRRPKTEQGAQLPVDSALERARLPLDRLPIVARIDLPSSADWIAFGFASVWIVNYRPDRVSRIDTATNRVVADVPIGRNGCLGILSSADRIWVASCVEGVVNEIDPGPNAIVRRIRVPIKGGREGAFAMANASFWIPDNASDSASTAVVRVDARTGEIVGRVTTGARSDVAVAGFGSVWVASSTEGVVVRIDPATNGIIARIPVGESPKFMAAGEGALWVQNRADGSVSRIDPASNRETARIAARAPTRAGDISAGGGAVWLSVNGMPVTRIDPRTNTVTHQYVGGDGADAIRWGAGALWVADHKIGQVWRIDAARITPR